MLMGGCLPSMISEPRHSSSKRSVHVPGLHYVQSLDLIALFGRSPLNGRDATGCGLRDACAGVAYQAMKVKL